MVDRYDVTYKITCVSYMYICIVVFSLDPFPRLFCLLLPPPPSFPCLLLLRLLVGRGGGVLWPGAGSGGLGRGRGLNKGTSGRGLGGLGATNGG